MPTEEPRKDWRHILHTIIFEADTRAGRAFDITLIGLILLSVLAVVLESVSSIRATYVVELRVIEWAFTILFTIEYILRLISVGRPIMYARSFFGLVDLLAIIPTYLSALIPGTQFLLVIRLLRILRIFRILKLAKYVVEAQTLVLALHATKRKIEVFLFVVITLVVIIGSIMYVIEGEEHGFTSIPTSIYWTIVTLTTVGYGDISPSTPLGQALASLVMILGYGIIAVPTGLVTAELMRKPIHPISTQACPACSREGHDFDALFCKYCGQRL
ncbi:MAG: ion transporter [Rhodothermales bacterium]|nr:ion transporter [Rhodothermales bacterium]